MYRRFLHFATGARLAPWPARAALLAAVLAVAVAGCSPAEKPEARKPAPHHTAETTIDVEMEPVEEPTYVAPEPDVAEAPRPPRRRTRPTHWPRRSRPRTE